MRPAHPMRRTRWTRPRRVASPVDVVRRLARRRRRPWLVLLALILLAAVAWADRRGWLLYDGGDLRRYDGQTVIVSHVADGDTIEVRSPDRDRATTRVRLWGIDAPERARPEENRLAEPFAEEARTVTRDLVLDRPVTLRLEPHETRDRYGRLLAFVELADGSLLNEHLLAQGMARAEHRWSHRHVDRFALIERQARNDRRGIWSRPGP